MNTYTHTHIDIYINTYIHTYLYHDCYAYTPDPSILVHSYRVIEELLSSERSEQIRIVSFSDHLRDCLEKHSIMKQTLFLVSILQ